MAAAAPRCSASDLSGFEQHRVDALHGERARSGKASKASADDDDRGLGGKLALLTAGKGVTGFDPVGLELHDVYPLVLEIGSGAGSMFRFMAQAGAKCRFAWRDWQVFRLPVL